MLGHGAGGGVTAPDLVTAAEEAARRRRLASRWSSSPTASPAASRPRPAHQLDAAWLAVVERCAATVPRSLCGGRSSGARVACRTAAGTGAAGVLCLAFPLHPPGRPEKTRLGELEAVEVPVLIVQGESDPFGMPPEAPGREVVRLRGNHGLKSDRPGLRAAVAAWLERRLTEAA